jgi:cytochrome c oxidase assembly factor CtaG
MSFLALISADLGSTPVLSELLRSWSFPLLPLVSLLLALVLYLRGWWSARRTRPAELPTWRAACFVSGVIALWIALASPIDALDDYLLTAHMIQHFLLMSVAPPLIVLGAPVVPILRGMPLVVVRGLRPLFRARWIRRMLQAITHPVFAWIAMNVAYLGWHVPAMFELTFRAEWIHDSEHLCFFMTSLVFWWVVLEPWPGRSRWPRWAMIPYLLSADILNTVLSATLAFAGRVLYPSYAEAPRICFLTPLKDQVAAGAEMWVLNSLVMLAPAVVIAMKELSPRVLTRESVAPEARSAVRG